MFKFQLAITLSMAVILNCITSSVFAVSIHHSNTAFVQGNCIPEFFLDADPFSDEIADLKIVVTAVDARGKTIDSGSLEIDSIGDSAANRYKTAHLAGGNFCGNSSTFIITKATGKINGKPVNLLSKNLISIADFKPVPVKIKAVHEEVVHDEMPSVCGLVTTKKSPLNIRRKASRKAKVIGRASQESTVLILETVGSWHKVQLNDGTVGYAKGKYIAKAGEADDYVSCGIVATKSSSLNIRAGQNRNSKIVGTAQKGTALHVLGVFGAWYQVKLNNGKVGYASSDYIDYSLGSSLSSSSYVGGGYTVTIRGFAGSASYTGCNSKERCISISEASHYSQGNYTWENDGYNYNMSPIGNRGKYQLSISNPQGKRIVNEEMTPAN